VRFPAQFIYGFCVPVTVLRHSQDNPPITANFTSPPLKWQEEDGNVRSECEEDEGTDCGDGDSDSYW